jgi:RNA polymerase sigma factor (sigma-70 family)
LQQSRILTEQEIVEGCKHKNPLAQEALYNLYGSRIKMICLRYVKNYSDAEDLFHESLIKVFQKIESFKNKGSFEGWIKTITVNTAIDHYHKQNKLRNTVQEYIAEENHPADQDDFFDNIMSTLQTDDLLVIINQLPDGYKVIFNLYALENYSHKEISAMLKISEGTSKSQLSKARRFIRKLVHDHLILQDERRKSR